MSHQKIYPKIDNSVLRMPINFYRGHREVKGDRDFIASRLGRLSVSNRHLACIGYSRIYGKYFELREYQKARVVAAKYLARFVRQYGITKQEIADIKARESIKEKIEEMIQRCKDAKKPTGTILGMADEITRRHKKNAKI